MATVRQRGNKWEIIFKNKKLLGDKPFYFTLETEEEARNYAARSEAILATGVVPEGWIKEEERMKTIGDVIRGYMVANHVPITDARVLNVVYSRVGNVRLDEVNYAWVVSWVTQMKTELNLSPTTIRHHVGSLARCFDWASNMNVVQLLSNPIRQLPKRYAQYSNADAKAAESFSSDFTKRVDNQRDRRLVGDENERIDEAIIKWRSFDKSDKTDMFRHSYAFLKLLALETAMRLREMYTLRMDQISIEAATIFLEKTKNGSTRQVPMTSVAMQTLTSYREMVEERGWLQYFNAKDALLPWWNGDASDDDYLTKLTMFLSRKYSSFHKAAKVDDFHFHDYRHEATSRFFERTVLTDFEIMKITGHSSTRMLSRYSNLRGSNLAKKLW